MYERYKNVFWSVPFLFENHELVFGLLNIIKEAGDPFPFKYAYGGLLNAWSGGEIAPMYLQDEINIPRFVFENEVIPVVAFAAKNIDEEKLKDEFANNFLDVYSPYSEFLITSDILYNHIKSRYPNAKCIASAMKSYYELERGKEVEYYKRLLDKYERVVLLPEYVKNGFTQDFEKYEDTSRFEVIVNNPCIANCPKRKEHYETVEMGIEYKECPMKDMNFNDLYKNSLSLTHEEISKLINECGIRHLKLRAGKHSKGEFISSILGYMLSEYGVSSLIMNMVNHYGER